MKVRTNQEVLLAWQNRCPAFTKNLYTTGRSLYSFGQLVGVTYGRYDRVLRWYEKTPRNARHLNMALRSVARSDYVVETPSAEQAIRDQSRAEMLDYRDPEPVTLTFLPKPRYKGHRAYWIGQVEGEPVVLCDAAISDILGVSPDDPGTHGVLSLTVFAMSGVTAAWYRSAEPVHTAMAFVSPFAPRVSLPYAKFVVIEGVPVAVSSALALFLEHFTRPTMSSMVHVTAYLETSGANRALTWNKPSKNVYH